MASDHRENMRHALRKILEAKSLKDAKNLAKSVMRRHPRWKEIWSAGKMFNEETAVSEAAGEAAESLSQHWENYLKDHGVNCICFLLEDINELCSLLIKWKAAVRGRFCNCNKE